MANSYHDSSSYGSPNSNTNSDSNPYSRTSTTKGGRPTKSLHATIEDIVVEEIEKAEEYVEGLESTKRMANWDRYYGKPLGNETQGRSKFMSRDVMETIEWIMPSIMSTFASSGDPKIEISIEGQPPIVGRALMEKIQEDLNNDDDRSMYIFLYQWFKDALVSDTAFVSQSWNATTSMVSHRLPMLDRQQMMMVEESDELELLEYTDNGDGTYSDVDVMVEELEEEGVEANNIPHWDALVSKDAKYMNDEYGKGYKTKVTLDYILRVNEQFADEGRSSGSSNKTGNRGSSKNFFVGLDKLKYYLTNDRSMDDGEYVAYMDGAEDSSGVTSVSSYLGDGDPDALDAKQTLSLVQWYTRCDVDGDGMLENIVCWVAEGKVLLRWELNDDDAIMMSAISPIIDCYKLFGIAYTDLIADIQNLKTMIIRRILDNFDFSTLGRTFVKPGGRVPIRELLENIPGDTILMDPEYVRTEYPKPFDSRVLALIEYADSVKENRTGSTRYNQGTDADSLNKTAAGIDMIQSASQKRIDMICRLFAETGMRDFYKKCALLYQRNQTEPFTINLLGQQVTVRPEQLQGKIKCKSNLGVEAQIGAAEADKIAGIVKFLSTLNQIFPGIIGPKEIHNMAVKFVANMGNKQPDTYVAPLAEFMQQLKVTQEQAQKAQEFKNNIETEKIKTDRMKVQIEAKRVGVELKDVLLGNQTRIRTKVMDVERKGESDKLRFIADMAKIRAQREGQRESNVGNMIKDLASARSARGGRG